MSNIVPTLACVYPNGSADVNEFHAAGGVAALIGSLLEGNYLYEDVSTILGEGLSKYRNKLEVDNGELFWKTKSEITDQSIIRDCNNPFNASGGLKTIKGNIGTGIIKISALKNSKEVIKAPARVFEDQEDVIKAFDNNEFESDTIIVVRNQGPSSNGMPELHKLTSLIGVLRSRGLNIALVTDGRMSGASGGFPAIIHLYPEAAKGGNIAKINNGDLIKIDLESGNLELKLSTDELRSRKVNVPETTHQGVGRELFEVFRNNVDGVETGASVFK